MVERKLGVAAIVGVALGLAAACSDSPNKRSERGDGGAAGETSGGGGAPLGEAGSGVSSAGLDGAGEPAAGGAGGADGAGIVGGAAGDTSVPGEAGAGGAGLPSGAGIRLSWVFQGAVSGDVLTCADVAGTHVAIQATQAGVGAEPTFEESIPCAETSRTIVVEPPNAYYAIELTLTNLSRTMFYGEAEQLLLPLAVAPCDEVVDDVCLQVEEAVILVDGL